MPASADAPMPRLLPDLAPQVLGAVVRRFRDFAASEDAVQEAVAAAATQWPRDGVPDNPRGWLIQVAARRIDDHARAARRHREALVVSPVLPEDVLYLIFNEGYTASSGAELHRSDLSNEALRLTRMLHRAVPDDAENAGLLALMLLTDARRAARTGPAGELVLLDAQDRSLWDRAAIAEGLAIVTATLPRGAVGPYQLGAWPTRAPRARRWSSRRHEGRARVVRCPRRYRRRLLDRRRV